MKTNIELVIMAWGLMVAAPAFAQDGKPSIFGEWRMTSLQATKADGSVVQIPYSGQVIFARSGTLSVQAMDADPGAKPTTYTANAYEAYYGPVQIDQANRTFSITVTSSLVRDLIGQKLVRKFEVSHDKLVIMPATPGETWRVTYERQ
ncbi:lipocalin-like domain-containing protein [uncultured Caulobacter sp.]|uniref:lipocalin-like domain-containing protein n=1 Tax=uncultured Caulobacter sp. TaxID=158749 RepID=UPI0026372F49|nr:lipocalin-like domain-containing protein [uncultured Caulobacter sp.]